MSKATEETRVNFDSIDSPNYKVDSESSEKNIQGRTRRPVMGKKIQEQDAFNYSDKYNDKRCGQTVRHNAICEIE
jgi:hypothetical protein